MLKKIQAAIVKNHNLGRANICKHCVWSKSEEMYDVKEKKHQHYCGLHLAYKFEYSSCSEFVEELEEAKPGSTELEMDLDIDKTFIPN